MLAVYLMVVIAVGVVSIWIIAQNVNVSALNTKMEYLMDWLKIMFAMMEQTLLNVGLMDLIVVKQTILCMGTAQNVLVTVSFLCLYEI